MRKVIMGMGIFLVVVGLIQLILSVALIGGVKGQIEEIDPLIEDAAGMLTDVADSVDKGAVFLEDMDPRLAELDGTIGDTIDDSVGRIGDLDARLADAEGVVPGGIDDWGEYLGTSQTDIDDTREFAVYNIARTRELLGTVRARLEGLRQLAVGGILDTREYLKTARADLGGLSDDLSRTSEGMVGLGIGGMIGGMIGGLRTYMIITSILFMATGVGLFLLGKKEES